VRRRKACDAGAGVAARCRGAGREQGQLCCAHIPRVHWARKSRVGCGFMRVCGVRGGGVPHLNNPLCCMLLA
jgi:hypothetical protein